MARIYTNAAGMARISMLARNYTERRAAEVRDNAITLAPVMTGRLKSSIYLTPGTNTWQVVASVPYAAYVELGTSAHEIRPNSAPALYWVGAQRPGYKSHWHPGGRPYRKVNHPGASAQSYLWAAVLAESTGV